MEQKQQREKFEFEYKRLNAQQRKAVDTIDGPVMVIAGPGTGKTQILSARIGKILLDTDTQPENILCLTYTDAGVVAMRKRLLSFIGAAAYKVNIYTFHAFCNDVIQENLSLFEKKAMDAISDLERIELLKQLIDSFKKDNPLKRYRGDVYFEVNNLQSLFSTMKREGWSPELINTNIDAYLKDIETRDDFIYKKAYRQFKAGDKKQNKIDEEHERMKKLRAAVNEFENFQQLMRSRNSYDFDDMINWVIKAFEENTLLLTRYQEQFLYILVDEYQDTSGTQNRLVQLLINYWDKPNVFVVGDDDQSIYRFQGANVENMLAFAESYQEDLMTVVLTSNYRSTQPILNVSKSLIDRNDERLIKHLEGLSKELLSHNTQISHLTHLPVIKSYETQRHEMIDVTMQVERLIEQGIAPGRIAVIYKENKYGGELAKYFKVKNIPVYSKRTLNILQLPFAQKIIMLLRYLAAEHDTPYGGDEMLFELLHFDWFNIPAIEIAKLSVEVADKNFTDQKTSLRRLLHEKSTRPPKDLFSQSINPGLKKASAVLEKLIADAPNLTLQNLFENIIREAGVLSYIMQSPEKFWLMQVLTGLFDFIKQETKRNALLQLKGLISILDLMEREDLSLPLVQVSGSEKGVNLLTAHGSKGMEYKHVFLVNCNAYSWEKKRKPGGGYTFPDTMFTAVPKNKEQEELRRLFYVALTRAEQHLHLSYCCYKPDGKETEPSMFIAEILEAGEFQVQPGSVLKEDMFQFQALEFEAAERAPEIEKAESDFINPLLDKFVMNVTALNNYLKCPLEFYFKNLIRIPSPKNEATEFGSAVHFALQRLFEKMQNNNSQFASAKDFIADFNWYMHRHRESFTKEQFERRLEYGVEVLTNYYNKYISTFNKIVAVERNIRNITVNGVPIKGKLDKLEFNGKEVNVVDYKTGDIEKAKLKLASVSDKQPNGGDYWRQAVFYKILIDNYEQKQWQVISTEFDFIEPNKKKEYQKEKIVVTPQDVETVKEQITTVWEKIQKHEFYTGCGKADCHWCNFVKTNDLAVALHELNEEPPEEEA